MDLKVCDFSVYKEFLMQQCGFTEGIFGLGDICTIIPIYVSLLSM